MADDRTRVPRAGTPVPDTPDRRSLVVLPPAPARAVGRVGRPDRWPTARELASLLVNGILTLPARYRRGMFLDITV